MARLTAADEQRMADRRSRLRQKKNPALVIRDDGMLYPNTAQMERHPRFRPYHGDPNASLQDRMRYLAGLQKKRAVVFEETDDPFDVNTASVDELVQFALDQYGAVLDPMKPRKDLQREVFRLSQLDASEIPAAQGGSDELADEPTRLEAPVRGPGARREADEPGEVVALGALDEGDAPTTTVAQPPRERRKPGPKPRGAKELATGLAAAGG
jgi:hypothetical protein